MCPEHKTNNKNDGVTLTVDEEEEKVKDVFCTGCAAASGGCKHALAFLMWLHRRSESQSTTEIDCYWKKPLLSNIGSTKKFIEVSELSVKSVDSSRRADPAKVQEFFKSVVSKANELQVHSQISRHLFTLKERDLYSL